MRPSDWQRLYDSIPRQAFTRLMGLFRRFCDGCDHLPEQAFRRVPDDPHGRLEEFVATGARVIGRRGTDDRRQTFFVTEVSISAAMLPVREPGASRQAMLPLELAVKKERKR